MDRRGLLLRTLVLAALLVGVPKTTRAAPPQLPPQSEPVAVAHSDQLGRFLVTAQGFTLYYLKPETPSKILCTGPCAVMWPPLLLPAGMMPPTAVSGMLARFGVALRPGGARQLTYAGHPLYRYAGDTGPGQTNGQGVKRVWFVATIVGAPGHASTPCFGGHHHTQARVVLPAGTGAAAAPLARAAGSSGGCTLFITSAVEHPDGTVTYPLHRGTSQGQTVYYIITDASTSAAAAAHGVNYAQKLANAANTAAVEKVTANADGTLNFPATVDFSPQRVVVPGPTGFPPSSAQPGAIGQTGYSPLIQLPDGTVENAPQLANASGQADKVISQDTVHMTVTYKETSGFQGGVGVRYSSTDASDPTAAALENTTYAPALNNAPTLNDDSTASSRASLAAFTNGQTGATNPQRQGLNSAILDGLDPLNVLRWNPTQGRYSPLWDVHLTQWSQTVVASMQNLRQTDYGKVQNLAQNGTITGPGGTPFTASGFIVDCPIVSRG